MLKGFRVMARFKSIRNTWLDPFARTHERKVELAWLRTYEEILVEVQKGLRADNLELAVKLVSLPDSVRGYGAVKDRYLKHALAQKESLLQQWRNGLLFHDAGGAGRIPVAQI
ncbi:indolepyruvate ferredoxin oxidoreductase [compost metagenome]